MFALLADLCCGLILWSLKVYPVAWIISPKGQRQIFGDRFTHVFCSLIKLSLDMWCLVSSWLRLSATMQRSAILGLLLACAVSLGSCAVILENEMPILWPQAASQLTDLPIHNGVVMPNPWNYLQRMSILRLLIGVTDPFMGSMGTNATDSPLWGLTLQLAWMMTSGEWCMNYTMKTGV